MEQKDRFFPQPNTELQVEPQVTENEEFRFNFTGDAGYKSAACAYGVKLGDYYFEIEVLPPKTPLPFVGV